MGFTRKGFLILSTLLLTACQAAQPTVREEAGPVAVPEDLTVRFVRQVVESMQESYLAGDVEGFMKYVSEGFYRGRARMEKNLAETLAARGSRDLAVEYGEVEAEEQRVTVTLRWRLSLSEGAAGVESVREGVTTLLFHRTDTINLVDFRGDPLFGIEGF